MSSATASTTSVRLRDIRALTRKQQAYVGVVAVNLVLAGALLGLYMTHSVANVSLVLGVAAGNLGVGLLGLHPINDFLQEVSA